MENQQSYSYTTNLWCLCGCVQSWPLSCQHSSLWCYTPHRRKMWPPRPWITFRNRLFRVIKKYPKLWQGFWNQNINQTLMICLRTVDGTKAPPFTPHDPKGAAITVGVQLCSCSVTQHKLSINGGVLDFICFESFGLLWTFFCMFVI